MSAQDWDVPSSSTPGVSRRRAPVPDDWDDSDVDDDSNDDEDPSLEQNQKIWEDANTKAPAPMPSVIISSTSGSVPPSGAFEPKMQILKRPKSSASPSSTPSQMSASSSVESLKGREARYLAARDRIFRSQDGQDTAPAFEESSAVSVLRNPKGPIESTSANHAKGFDKRQRRSPNARQLLDKGETTHLSSD